LTVLLFGVFAALAFTGLFDLIEASFYNPSIISSITRENTQNAKLIAEFLGKTQDNLSATLKTQAIRRGFLSSQNSGDNLDYPQVYSLIIESSEGIQWVRFIDPEGKEIFFSTLDTDIYQQDANSVIYHVFQETDFIYSEIAVANGGQPKYLFDEKFGRILFSFPIYDSFDSHWGTALFCVSLNTMLDKLIGEGRIKYGHDLTVITSPPGVLFGATVSGDKDLLSQISLIWRGEQKTAKLVSSASSISQILISLKAPQGFFVGRLANEEVFSLPMVMKIILLASFFITVFLTLFLLFNIRQDPIAVVQNRMKQLQVSLIEQFYDLKGETDWSRWIRELELRRGEITVQLKQGIDFEDDKNTDIDILINKAWDDFLAILSDNTVKGIDEEKLKSTIKRILTEMTGTAVSRPDHAAANTVPEKSGLLKRAEAIVKEIEETDEVEEIEELETVERKESPSKPSGDQGMTRSDLEYLASKIEFSTDSELDFPGEETIREDLEIVSPFSSMLSDLSTDDTGEEDSPEKSDNNIIEEREGVPYIKEEAANSGSASNKEFKDLVDSVTK